MAKSSTRDVDIDMARRAQAVEIFADRLRGSRDQRGLNQRELAEQAGLPSSSIAHFEGGRRRPSLENLARLSSALGVTTDYLLGRSDEPFILNADDPFLKELARLTPEDQALARAFVKLLASRRRRGSD